MIEKASVVIIGGGVMGTSTAYHLARLGCQDVVLVEKKQLASGSTGLSVGGIRLQFSSEANIRISLESLRTFERFAEEFEAEIDFRQHGYLFLATEPGDWAEFQINAAIQQRMGVPVRLLSPQEIGDMAPYLYLDDVVGGTFCPRDGYADPYSVAMGFAKQARRLGVRICEETEALDIKVSGGKVRAVATNQGEIATPVVVNVAGPWAAQVGRMAGLELPVAPYRRQVFVTAPFDELPKQTPLIIDFAPSFYFRREGASVLMGMTDHEEPSSFNTNFDLEFLVKAAEKAAHRAPVLDRADFMRGWGGLYAITPDNNPIIGQNIGGVEGFYCAVGFSGHGFMQSPAVGRILADLITTGQTDFDLSPFQAERFKVEELVGESRVV
ncbi:MAG: FAD-binding oxidoreductase [Chloroflexi bacterium]|nr:FAD-binding oxidoreductase [Chloroflexota bacterium]